MILEDSDVEDRLDSDKNLVNILTLKRNGSGPRIPKMVSNLIEKITDKSEENNKTIAKVFDVSSSEIAKTRNNNEERTSTAHNMAVELMVDSMLELRNRINEVDKPVQLSKIASDMSKIVGNLKSKQEDHSTKVQVNIYAPVVKNESDYETIEISNS